MRLNKTAAVMLSAVVSCFSPSIAWAGQLPKDYVGVTINQTQQPTVIEQFGHNELQDVPLHEYEQGYCYASNGVYAILSANMLADGYAVNHISIHNQNPGMRCQPTTKTLPSCIGEYCLEMNRSQIETMLGVSLTQVNNIADDYVAVFESIGFSELDVSYYITFNFKQDKATKVSVMTFATH